MAPNFVKQIQQRKIKWVGNVERARNMKIIQYCIGKTKRKRSLADLTVTWQIIVKCMFQNMRVRK